MLGGAKRCAPKLAEVALQRVGDKRKDTSSWRVAQGGFVSNFPPFSALFFFLTFTKKRTRHGAITNGTKVER